MGNEELCSPAMIYLVFSIRAYILSVIKNVRTANYCIGNYECETVNRPLVFIIKFLYIIFWTWILNLLCSNGYTNVAWIFILLPIAMFFFFVILMITKDHLKLRNRYREYYKEYKGDEEDE